MTVLRRIDGFLFGAETERRLAFTSVALAVVLGLRIALGPYAGLAGQPSALFRPVPFLRWLPAMPPLAVIVGVQVIGAAAAAVAVADRSRRRLAFIVAWTCLLFLAGLRGSRGKLLHNDVLLLLACVPFLLAPVAGWAHRRSTRYGWPLRTALVVVAGAYFFCGLSKLERSGLAWVTTDNLRNVFGVALRSGRLMFPEVAQRLYELPWLDHLLASAVLGLELTFPVVLLWPRVRPYYAALAVAFHAGTWLTLGIDYWAWAAVAAIVLVDWVRIARLPLRRPASVAVGDPDLIPHDDREVEGVGQLAPGG